MLLPENSWIQNINEGWLEIAELTLVCNAVVWVRRDSDWKEWLYTGLIVLMTAIQCTEGYDLYLYFLLVALLVMIRFGVTRVLLDVLVLCCLALYNLLVANGMLVFLTVSYVYYW